MVTFIIRKPAIADSPAIPDRHSAPTATPTTKQQRQVSENRTARFRHQLQHVNQPVSAEKQQAGDNGILKADAESGKNTAAGSMAMGIINDRPMLCNICRRLNLFISIS